MKSPAWRGPLHQSDVLIALQVDDLGCGWRFTKKFEHLFVVQPGFQCIRLTQLFLTLPTSSQAGLTRLTFSQSAHLILEFPPFTCNHSHHSFSKILVMKSRSMESAHIDYNSRETALQFGSCHDALRLEATCAVQPFRPGAAV